MQKQLRRFGTTNIPVNTFNKVWIVPEKAVVYENAKAGTAYVVESKLKVMLEQDYLSLQKHEGIQSWPVQVKDTNQLGSQIVREVVIPQLTKEVNEDKNFAQLRQVYNSLILATWYKKKIKNSILAQVYENKNKVAGVNIDDPQEKQRIYERYLQAFKKGAYNYIKEEIDPVTQETIPRKYFSGGLQLIVPLEETTVGTMVGLEKHNAQYIEEVGIDRAAITNFYNNDAAMNTDPLVRRVRKAWERKLEENRPYWRLVPSLGFSYNYRAQHQLHFDPLNIPRRKVGIFYEIPYSDFPERNDLDFIPEDVPKNEGRGLARELRNELLADPDNHELVIVPARWPMTRHHLLAVSRTEKPQQETGEFLLSAFHWAQRGLTVEFHKRGEGVDYFHLQMFDYSDAPITKYVSKFKTDVTANEVSLGLLEGYPVPHIAIKSGNLDQLKSATMAIHRLLDTQNIPYTRDILRDGHGQLIVVFFCFSGVPGDFRFNTLGEIRSNDFSLTEGKE